MAAVRFAGQHREREQHRKPAALALFALHVDAAVHVVHDSLRDGHAKARALDAAHRGRALPLEGLEDPGCEFLAHADAGVRDRQLVIRQVVPASGLLQGDGDRAPFRRKFIGVAHQIEQNAVEPVGVAQHPAVLDGVTVHRKGHVLLAHLFGKHVPDTVQHIAQIGLRRLQLHVPGLDAAHLQHVVDEGQQVVAGGAEACVTEFVVGGFMKERALATKFNDTPERACRPFNADRDGFVVGEGAAVLILESEEHAKARGAKVYAELAGYGATSDAYHITAPSPEGTGAEQCMRLAMEDAGISPAEVDYINAHGTSTKMNDSCESAAIRRIFGDDVKRVRVSSTKSMTGHLLGASAAVEAVITVEAVQKDFVPPTVNYKVPDPECSLDVVPGNGYPMKTSYALSNSFGFGGHNVTLVFRKA